ncbi:MAG: glutamine--fructose-6-phosphate transaminase (isomerizing) [Oligoflexia bacterium]|nr:glutamine--fructose-6-phosphate transaminase (isomerizing) [Oligoflexia bacterium]
MCGIVGYAGKRAAVDILIRGLKRLEYRGYDSSGIAFVRGDRIEIIKSEGRIDNVEKMAAKFAETSPGGNLNDVHFGIGHTRWATHGKPTTQNAHPHRTGHVVLVHNGIIENYQELKKKLVARGHQPQSETDSELFGFLVLEEMEKGASLMNGVRLAFDSVEGACSVVVMSERELGVLVGARRGGSPLVAAIDPEGGAILASDAQPLIDITREVIFVEQGDVVVGDSKGVHFFDLKSGAPIQRKTTRLDWSVETLSKQGFAHYMLKEIHEQPTALVDTFNGLLDLAKRGDPDPFPFADREVAKLLESASDIVLIACGTSWHAALLGKYWIERWAGVRVSVELASEFRYRQPVLAPQSLVIALSQSGETADTLAVVRQVNGLGNKTMGITNVRGSTLSREATAVLYTSAGPEIGVAATKTFSAQLLSLLIIAGHLGSKKGRKLEPVFDELLRVPHLLAGELAGTLASRAHAVAKAIAGYKGFFFIGRGYSFPIALEGALKLKEIAYVHAEGYAGGELKHGPIAMIDPNMVVVVLAPRDSWREKTLSNLEEVKARGAVVLAIGDPSDEALKQASHHWIALPEGARELDECWAPFFLSPVVQLLSYELALLKGTDVDKPRNLAKSVTVE